MNTNRRNFLTSVGALFCWTSLPKFPQKERLKEGDFVRYYKNGRVHKIESLSTLVGYDISYAILTRSVVVDPNWDPSMPPIVWYTWPDNKNFDDLNHRFQKV